MCLFCLQVIGEHCHRREEEEGKRRGSESWSREGRSEIWREDLILCFACCLVCVHLFVFAGHRKTISGERERKEEDRRTTPCFAPPGAGGGSTRRQWWWRVGRRAATPPAAAATVPEVFFLFFFWFMFFIWIYCISLLLFVKFNENKWKIVCVGCVSCILVVKRNKKKIVWVCVLCFIYLIFMLFLLKKKNVKWNIKILFFSNLLFTVGIRINKS